MTVRTGASRGGPGLCEPPQVPPNLRNLREALLALDYQESALARLLGVSDLPLMLTVDLPGYLHRCQQESSPLALAACLFLLGIRVAEAPLLEWMSELALEGLLQQGLLRREPQGWRALSELYPCLGKLIFTDRHLSTDFHAQHVYELGTDSYVLARVTPRKTGQRALDLCTGSGVHAILATDHHSQVVAVDLNPRALQFARFNAAFNEVESRCNFLQGDLYQPLSPELRFDLITANPPFVPTGGMEMELHRGAGRDGEEVSRRLVEGLPDHLKVGGTFSMVLDYPIFSHSRYLERLKRWLGGQSGWGVAVLLMGVDSREEYIKAHLDASDPSLYAARYQEFLTQLESQGIEEMAFGNVFIRRLEDSHPGFSVIRHMKTPTRVWSEEVEQWLQALERVSRPNWNLGTHKPRLGPLVGELWLNRSKDRGRVEFALEGWSKPLEVHGLTVQLAHQLDGRKTQAQLTHHWARRHHVSLELAEADVRERLGWMLSHLVAV